MFTSTSPYLTLKGQVTDICTIASGDGRPQVMFTFTPEGKEPVRAIAYRSDATDLLARVANGTWVLAKGLTFEDPEAEAPRPTSGFILTSFQRLAPADLPVSARTALQPAFPAP